MAIVGAGRAGIGLALALGRGYVITGIVARSRASAARASRLLGRSVGTTDPAAALRRAEVILICVPDSVIPSLAGSFPPLPLRGRKILHTSGSLTAEALAPLRERGASVGSLHPLTSFPAPGRGRADLRGVAFALDGDPAAVNAARSIVKALGGAALAVPGPARAAYHLAATLAAGGLVALLDSGLDLAARRLGIGERRARAAFLPLARAALQNVARSGARRALTGPAARGDAATVARHLEELRAEQPGLMEIYRLLSLRAVAMAEADGRLDPAGAEDLRRLLGLPGDKD